jgi:hypothetical protein
MKKNNVSNNISQEKSKGNNLTINIVTPTTSTKGDEKAVKSTINNVNKNVNNVNNININKNVNNVKLAKGVNNTVKKDFNELTKVVITKNNKIEKAPEPKKVFNIMNIQKEPILELNCDRLIKATKVPKIKKIEKVGKSTPETCTYYDFNPASSKILTTACLYYYFRKPKIEELRQFEKCFKELLYKPKVTKWYIHLYNCLMESENFNFYYSYFISNNECNILREDLLNNSLRKNTTYADKIKKYTQLTRYMNNNMLHLNAHEYCNFKNDSDMYIYIFCCLHDLYFKTFKLNYSLFLDQINSDKILTCDYKKFYNPDFNLKFILNQATSFVQPTIFRTACAMVEKYEKFAFKENSDLKAFLSDKIPFLVYLNYKEFSRASCKISKLIVSEPLVIIIHPKEPELIKSDIKISDLEIHYPLIMKIKVSISPVEIFHPMSIDMIEIAPSFFQDFLNDFFLFLSGQNCNLTSEKFIAEYKNKDPSFDTSSVILNCDIGDVLKLEYKPKIKDVVSNDKIRAMKINFVNMENLLNLILSREHHNNDLGLLNLEDTDAKLFVLCCVYNVDYLNSRSTMRPDLLSFLDKRIYVEKIERVLNLLKPHLPKCVIEVRKPYYSFEVYESNAICEFKEMCQSIIDIHLIFKFKFSDKSFPLTYKYERLYTTNEELFDFYDYCEKLIKLKLSLPLRQTPLLYKIEFNSIKPNQAAFDEDIYLYTWMRDVRIVCLAIVKNNVIPFKTIVLKSKEEIKLNQIVDLEFYYYQKNRRLKYEFWIINKNFINYSVLIKIIEQFSSQLFQIITGSQRFITNHWKPMFKYKKLLLRGEWPTLNRL